MNHKIDFNCLNPKCLFFMKVIYGIAFIAILWQFIIPRSGINYRTRIYEPVFGGLNNYDVVLKVNETYHLYLFNLNKRVTYESSDFKVATVNLNGSVRAWRPGITIIRVKCENKVLKCRVRVVDLSRDSIKISVGSKKRIYMKHVMFGVKYDSSDNNVATVNSFGVVKGVGKGTTKITASYKGKKFVCKVFVQ